MKRRQFICTGPVLASLGFNALAQAPATSQARKFIVPGSPGTGTDAIARYMSRAIEQRLQTSVVVDNKPGAGGIIGTDFAAKAPPDGNTILITSANHYALPWIYDNVPYKAAEDFLPIAGFGSSTLLMVVAPNSPYATARDIIKDSKGGNSNISYSSAGNGTLSHICGALLNTMAGIHLMHVPYKSASQGLIDVSAGIVSVGFLGVAGAMPLVQAGKLKAIAVTGKSRSAHFPKVPTLNESGLDGYDIDSPFMALAPKGTSGALIARLSQEFLAATHDPAYQTFCASQGLETTLRQTTAELAAAQPKEFQKWKELAAIALAKRT